MFHLAQGNVEILEPVHVRDTAGLTMSTAADKTLAVLSAVLRGDRAMRLTDVSSVTGLPKSTVHRLIATLVAHGILTPHHGRYRSEAQLTGLSPHKHSAEAIAVAATAHLVDLQRASRASAFLSVLNCCEVRHVAQVHDELSGALPVEFADPVPAHLSPAGRVLLAHDVPTSASCPGLRGPSPESAAELMRRLREIRRTGFEFDGEKALAARAIAVRVLVVDSHSRPPGMALSLCLRSALPGVMAHMPLLRRSASIIADDVQRAVRTIRPTSRVVADGPLRTRCTS